MTWTLYTLLVLGWMLCGLLMAKLHDRFYDEDDQLPLFVHVAYGPLFATMGFLCYLDQAGWRGFGWAAFIVKNRDVLMWFSGFYFASSIWLFAWMMP